VLLVRLLLAYAGVGTLPRLLICTAVAVAVYVPIGAWRAPDVVDELRRFQRRRRRAGGLAGSLRSGP
jgi:hypothetical protein